ncbi:MAG: radical SAM protein, partial [Candidatus Cloacimonadales bacterium]|nr:radical SAM protein [Candidatus Cloacimonadales bacterium]
IDFNFYSGDIYADLKKWNPAVIGIGGTTGTRKGSFKLAEICKEALPKTPVVFGGIHATFTAEDTLKHVPEIDYVLKGEGEFSFLSFVEIFIEKKKGNLFNIPGLSYRHDNQIIHNKPVRIDDLDTLPLPARELCEGNYKIKLDYLGIEAEFLMTSRGCPFACDFCAASRMFPGGIRYRSIDNVKKEIDLILSQKKVKALKIFDSTFTASRQHVLNFCEMIKPYNLLWECEIRVDTVDFELMKKMKEAGCCYVDIGLETTDSKILQSIYKTINVKQVEDVLSWCRKLQIKTKVFFTFGHLGQSYQSCLNDANYIKQNKDKIDFFATTVGIRVYPGTQLEKKAIAAGIIPTDFSWVKFKPSPWRHLLFEFEDQLLLTQKHLGFYRLSKIVWKLVMNGTVGSFNYICELIFINLYKLIRQLFLNIKQAGYQLKRASQKGNL